MGFKVVTMMVGKKATTIRIDTFMGSRCIHTKYKRIAHKVREPKGHIIIDVDKKTNTAVITAFASEDIDRNLVNELRKSGIDVKELPCG